MKEMLERPGTAVETDPAERKLETQFETLKPQLLERIDSPFAHELQLEGIVQTQKTLDRGINAAGMGVYHEAAEDGVAGDYWNIKEIDEDRMLVAIEDHKNHGLSAAMLRELAHTDLGGPTDIEDPVTYMKNLHETMAKTMNGKVTAPSAAFEIDKLEQKIRYVGQGTPLILVNPKTKEVQMVMTKNAGPVGAAINPTFKKPEAIKVGEQGFEPGMIFLTGTDAFWEGHDENNKPVLDQNVFKQMVAEQTEEGITASELTKRLSKELKKKLPGQKLQDDATLIAIQL